MKPITATVIPHVNSSKSLKIKNTNNSIENLFRTYSYKNYQLRLEKIEKNKLSKYFYEYFLKEKNSTVLTVQQNTNKTNDKTAISKNANAVTKDAAIAIASLKPFRLLQEALGYPAASLKDFYVSENLENGNRAHCYHRLAKWLLEQFKKNEKIFVAAKVAIQDNDAIKQLFSCGFNYVASESIYSLRLNKKYIDGIEKEIAKIGKNCVRLAEAKDHKAIKEIACTNHDINKFHLDASISKSTSQIIYKKTIEASINNKNHTLLVHELNGEITGFITVIFNAALSSLMGRNYGSLDYISVKKSCREQGIGLTLNNAGLLYLSQKKCEVVSVKTLSHNYPACNLLLASSFKLASSSLILHRNQDLCI